MVAGSSNDIRSFQPATGFKRSRMVVVIDIR